MVLKSQSALRHMHAPVFLSVSLSLFLSFSLSHSQTHSYLLMCVDIYIKYAYVFTHTHTLDPYTQSCQSRCKHVHETEVKDQTEGLLVMSMVFSPYPVHNYGTGF